jgi:hypothetical protein
MRDSLRQIYKKGKISIDEYDIGIKYYSKQVDQD